MAFLEIFGINIPVIPFAVGVNIVKNDIISFGKSIDKIIKEKKVRE